MKASPTDEAISIRRLRFSETSLIVWWLTRQHGMVHTLVRRRSNRLGEGGPPDVFYRAEITWARGRSSGLAHLREFQTRTVYPGLRQGFARLAAASYFAEAISRAVEHESPIPELFDLLEKALGYLDQREPSWRLVERFERRLFGSLGLDDGNRSLEEVRSAVFSPPLLTYTTLRRALEGDQD